MKEGYDVVIVGSGLGGLTAAALLSRRGFSTFVVERLPRVGGRFTNIPHKGFQLTSGALHLIPHQRGVLQRLLRRELQSNLEFIDTGPIPIMFEGSIIQSVREVPALLDSIFRFSLGLKFKEVPILERAKFMVKAVVAGKPCMPKGGCGSIIQTLERIILDNKGEIIKKTSMSQIAIEKSNVAGVVVRSRDGLISKVKTSVLISDIGPKNTIKTLPDGPVKEDFKRQLGKIMPTEGIKISIRSNKPILSEITGEKTGLMFTPSCERIAGIVEPSSMDPDLAPPGKSLLMTHQEVLSPDTKQEIQIGVKDLTEIISSFKKKCRILAVQVFKGDWPVNHARQGQDMPQITPIKGLYLVGDGVKPSGFIMAEGVVESARRVVEQIVRT